MHPNTLFTVIERLMRTNAEFFANPVAVTHICANSVKWSAL